MSEKKGNSLANAAGSAVTWSGPDGKVYKIKPLTIGDLADFESFLQAGKIKALLSASEDMDKETKQVVLTNIMCTPVTSVEVANGMSSMAGIRFLCWKALSKGHPDMELSGVDNLVTLDNFDEISTIIQNAGGSLAAENPPEEKESL